VFEDWAAVVVAGDWHAHSGGATEAFDNARRDVSRSLESAGFRPANMQQFSVRPERYKDTRPLKSDPQKIYETLADLTGRTKAGCLFYVSSHGAPQGALIDQGILTPGMLAAILERTCGARPTIVVISACFSGVYIPAVAAPNRMVLTAARPDRTSFGCGESNKYPFFDECFLESMSKTREFIALANAARACVSARETVEGMSPPSEPQVFVGWQLRTMLPLYAFGS
jgi:hypothetical protein